MKRFIIKILVAGLVALVLASVTDVIVSKGLLNMEDCRFQSWNDMLKGGMSHDVLIMGNSRGFSHFDPQILDSALSVNSYCIGIGGFPINIHMVKYDFYREKNAKPKLIIYNVDYITLNIMNLKRQFTSEQFFPAMYSKTINKAVGGLGYDLFDRYVPMVRYFGYQKVIKDGILEFLHIKHHVDRSSYKGHSPEPGPWDPSILNETDKVSYCFVPEAVEMFESFLSECKREGIEVVLVDSPIYYEFSDMVVDLDSLTAYYQRTADIYGFRFLDYTKDCYLCEDSSYFSNPVHLSPEGTKLFSRMFSHDLDSIMSLRKDI